MAGITPNPSPKPRGLPPQAQDLIRPIPVPNESPNIEKKAKPGGNPQDLIAELDRAIQ